jgi:hypothetical protein
MGISSDADASDVVVVLPSVSAANTAAATSGWIDCRKYKGTLRFIQITGAITGTLDGKLQGADDSGGTNGADITGATFTQVTSANKVQTCIIPATKRPYIKYIGTVGTGPVLIGVALSAHPGITG